MLNDHQPMTRVLVLHAEPLMAIGLMAALRPEPHLHVTLDGVPATAVTPTPGHAPADTGFDVVLTDHAQGVQLAAALRSGRALSLHRLRNARVVVMTNLDREQDVRVAMEAGVYGYLSLGCAVEELRNCVQQVASGARYLCGLASQRMADSLAHEALTLRETDVLMQLAQGQCNKLIASELNISTGTVKAHLKSIFSKLQVASRTEAANIALQRGLVVAHHSLQARPARQVRPAMAASQAIAPVAQPYALSARSASASRMFA